MPGKISFFVVQSKTMNQFGRLFRIQIFGESHGPGVGVVIDGVPAGIPLQMSDFQVDIERRKPGKPGTTSRQESDLPIIQSGWFNGYTTGTPVMIWFQNNDQRSADYQQQQNVARPGHADFVAEKKYNGFQDYRGGGHFSGRMTLPLVAAGVIAKKIIAPISLSARLVEAGGHKDIEKAVQDAIEKGDSIGGLVKCEVSKVPIGLGEPFFDSVESLISHAIFSIPAVKGISFGSGFEAAKMFGSQHNDPIIDPDGRTLSNHAGGINGGISNGNPMYFQIAVKPTSSIGIAQQTIDFQTGASKQLEIRGRHDACIALRIPVVVEAVTAIVLADLHLINKKLGGLF